VDEVENELDEDILKPFMVLAKLLPFLTNLPSGYNQRRVSIDFSGKYNLSQYGQRKL